MHQCYNYNYSAQEGRTQSLGEQGVLGQGLPYWPRARLSLVSASTFHSVELILSTCQPCIVATAWSMEDAKQKSSSCEEKAYNSSPRSSQRETLTWKCLNWATKMNQFQSYVSGHASVKWCVWMSIKGVAGEPGLTVKRGQEGRIFFFTLVGALSVRTVSPASVTVESQCGIADRALEFDRSLSRYWVWCASTESISQLYCNDGKISPVYVASFSKFSSVNVY